MTEPSNFRLKNGHTIIIGTQLATIDDKQVITDGKDVQRIRILNDIVWEKTKSTSISVTGTPKTVNPGKTFNLTAVVLDSSGKTVNGNVVFSGNGISGNKTVKTSNGIATLQNISTTHTGQNTYTAHFEKTDIYLASEGTTIVTVNKETPVLTIIGETTIYDTWRIGVKLTASDNKTPLTNQSITLTIGGNSHTIKTNNKGIASYKITNLTGSKEATFKYSGNSQYNSTSIKKTYTIKSTLTTKLEYKASKLGSKNAPLQRWIKNSDTSYQCCETNVSCYGTDTIATSGGTYKKPDVLKITFKQNKIKKIKSATLTFKSKHGPACNGSYYGGLFDTAPIIKLSTDGSKKFTQGKGAKTFNKYTGYGGYQYSVQDILSQKITWSEKTVSSDPVISIQYPANEGVEEAYIKITSLSLKVSYIPTQSTNFA